MLPFGATVLEFSIATFFSAFIGIALIIAASKFVRARYIAAFAFGVYLWFFTDTIGDANYLNVNAGPVFSSYTFCLVVLFLVGLVAFFAVDGRLFAVGEETARYGMIVAVLAALAVGVHGFGEGADIGYTSSQTSIGSFLASFGGVDAGISWVIHKMCEPTIAAACYAAYAGIDRKRFVDKALDALILAAVFVVPAVIGWAAGYFVTFDHTYIFALGLGASAYAAARVVRTMFIGAGERSSGVSVKVALAIFVGFLCIFMGALLHS